MVFNRSAALGQVVPTLVYDDVGHAIKWLCESFGFREEFRYGPVDNPGGALLKVGTGSIMLTQSRKGQSPEWRDMAELRPPSPNLVTHTIMVHTENVDDHYARIKNSGPRILSVPQTYPFGERQYTVEDLEGHRWTFTQSVADVAPAEWGGRSA